MIVISWGSGVLTAKGVDLVKCKQLPVIVDVIPVPEIASKVVFILPKMPAAEIFSSALEEVAGGLTLAMFAEQVVVTCVLTLIEPWLFFSVVYWVSSPVTQPSPPNCNLAKTW